MESFTIRKEKGKLVALSSTRPNHIDKEWEVIEDIISPESLRTIVLKEKDLSEHKVKVKKLTSSLLKALKEESPTLEAILEDQLEDWEDTHLDKMQRAIDLGKPVKKREGCFKLIIGDGRRKSGSYKIQLAD